VKRGGPLARRTRLERHTPIEAKSALAPGKPLARRTAIRARNPKRAQAAQGEDFGPLADAVRRLPCCVAGCRRDPVDPAHVRSRGAGGSAWIEVDGRRVGNLAPLCRAHHTGGPGITRPQHQIGVPQFELENALELRLPGREAARAFTLAAVAEAVGRWFEDGGPEEGIEW